MSEKPSRRVREGFSLANPFSGAREARERYAVAGLGSFALCGARERVRRPGAGAKKG